MPDHVLRAAVLPAALAVAAQEVLLDGDVEQHGHDFLEGVVVLSGAGLHTCDSFTTPLSAGSVLLVRPGERHGFLQADSLRLVNLYIGPEVLRGELSWLRTETGLAALLWGRSPDGAREAVDVRHLEPGLLKRCRVSLRRLDPQERGGRVGRIAALLDVLDAIRGGLPGEAHRRPSRAGRELVDTVLGAVEENLAEPWTLASLAQRAHVSPAYLNELFNAHLGAPPMQVLSRLRAERAAALLRSTDLPIGRIAAAVGWPDPNYFARRFKAWQGISPGAYRRHP